MRDCKYIYYFTVFSYFEISLLYKFINSLNGLVVLTVVMDCDATLFLWFVALIYCIRLNCETFTMIL